MTLHAMASSARKEVNLSFTIFRRCDASYLLHLLLVNREGCGQQKVLVASLLFRA
jgi:hypothetical protein